jgi:nucleoside-diphosphate-sugar epimerase
VPGAEIRRHDVTDPDQAEAAVAGATVVFQCAQPPYHRWPQEFPALQRSIMRACEVVGAPLVATENLYGYGPVDVPMTEDLPMRATNRKGSTRARMCEELTEAHRSGRVATASVRASDFFGPGVDGSVYGGRFVPPIVEGGKAQVLGRPDALHSVTYVPDIADALVSVAGDPTSWGRAWHAPTAPAITQAELVALFADAAGTEPRYSKVPATVLRLVGLFNPGARETVEMLYEFEHDFVLDSSAFEEHFGVTATPLVDSVAATVAAARPAAAT